MPAYISNISYGIHYEECGPVTILTPMPRMGNQIADALARLIEENLAQKRMRILINLENLDRIGSQTLQVLLHGTTKAISQGGDLRLLRPGNTVIRYLKNNGVWGRFRIYQDRSTALNDFLGVLRATRPTPPEPEEPAANGAESGRISEVTSPVDDHSGILLTNSHLLATLIEVLHEKNILSQEEVKLLLESGADSVAEGHA